MWKPENQQLALMLPGSDRFDLNSFVLVFVQKVHMAGIIRHYKLLEMVAEQGVEFHSNVLNLCRAYSEFRPVHGDGECFYRSFIFSYLAKIQ